MYPDIEDVRQALPKQFPNAPSADTVWEDVVFTRSVLFEAQQICRNHGRHSQIPASDLLKFVEQVVSRPISPWAFVAALRLLGMKSNPVVLDPNDLSRAKVKFPPLDRFPAELWRERSAESLKQEIDEERIEMDRVAGKVGG